MKVTNEELIENVEAISDFLTHKFGKMGVHFALCIAGVSDKGEDEIITTISSNTESKELIQRLLQLCLEAVQSNDPVLETVRQVNQDA